MECNRCGLVFKETTELLTYCRSQNLPEPGFCPQCRIQTLYSYRNLRALYRRNCNLCHKAIITMFAPDAPRQVYCHDCWWSDSWDPCSYGREFDFTKTLAQQLDTLLHEVPLSPLISGNSENSDYVNFAYGNKDSYLVSASDYNEQCYYSSHLFKCREVVDCLFCIECELLYDCLDCSHCYSSRLLVECHYCRDSILLLECRNCSNCLGCVGLDRCEYMVLNRKVEQFEYEAIRKKLRQNPEAWNSFLRDFNTLCQTTPGPAAHLQKCEFSSGDHLIQSKNATLCFDSSNLEDCSALITSVDSKDCHFSIGVSKSELCYQVAGCPENYALRFSCYTWPTSSYLEYCFFCRSSSNAFACVALKKNENCILNKKYSTTDYSLLLKKIRSHLTETGEYGNFLPMQYSYFAYNETEAQEHTPLTKKVALEQNLPWRDGVWEMPKTLPVWPLPLTDVIPTEAEVIECSGCSRSFKLIQPELKFYEKCGVPIPQFCHDCRHSIRATKRNPRALRDASCDKCGTTTPTSEPKTSPRALLCTRCYGEWRDAEN